MATSNSVKRFGSRYGTRVKEKLGLIEAEHRKRHGCPSCGYTQVKRLAAGIWQCRKCEKKFAAKAYTL